MIREGGREFHVHFRVTFGRRASLLGEMNLFVALEKDTQKLVDLAWEQLENAQRVSLLISGYSLYPIWGAALGKHSRDLGTTFTYGMLMGMISPIIRIVFLFQEKKFKKPTRSS
jgi:hypothetical protein